MKEQEVKEHWTAAKFIRPNGSVLDFTGLYEVSDRGRVRSLNYQRSGKTKVLKLRKTKVSDGTLIHQIRMYKDTKEYLLTAHRLALSSFKESEYFPGAVADHVEARSETECCDRLDNLRWITQQQNTSTAHCIESKSKALMNHPSFSKRISVTDIVTGEVIEYPSAREAGRSLGINPKLPAAYICTCNGYCKKLNLHFTYID